MRLVPSLLLALLAAGPASACGASSDCAAGGGTYRVHLPPGPPTGAIIFAHGYKGAASGAMANAALRAVADDLGVALVALQSIDDDWAIPDAPAAGLQLERDETAYAQAVRDNAAARFGFDPERTILAGFSAGGMLVWNVACDAGQTFAAFVPVAGTFWGGPPEECATDAAIWHIHGTSDDVVPIGGRAIGTTRQGDVEAVLSMVRADKGMTAAMPVPVAGLDCLRWTGPAASLQYCRHPGGHVFRPDWLGAVWRATFPAG